LKIKTLKLGQEVAAKVKSGELSKTEAAEVLAEAKAENYAQLISKEKLVI
jgi:hypothetical protein